MTLGDAFSFMKMVRLLISHKEPTRCLTLYDEVARSSGADESIPEKRQRSPLPSDFYNRYIQQEKSEGNSDWRNDTYAQRPLLEHTSSLNS
ncbi:hypothetical protein CPZ30_16450 [Paenibacillus lautus]|nr:hypothetical protein CPZ30_16450 [Paenibacillus lautus]